MADICDKINWHDTRAYAQAHPIDSDRIRLLTELRKRHDKWQYYWVAALLVPPPSHRPTFKGPKGIRVDPRNELYLRGRGRAKRFCLMRAQHAPLLLQQEAAVLLQPAIKQVRLGDAVQVAKTPLPGVLTMLNSKTGLLRYNLLAKRVDYSGRSVIAPGPDLALDAVGLPRSMAYVRFRPFILKEMRDSGAVSHHLNQTT